MARTEVHVSSNVNFSSFQDETLSELMILMLIFLTRDKTCDKDSSSYSNIACNEVYEPIISSPLEFSFNSIVDLCQDF